MSVVLECYLQEERRMLGYIATRAVGKYLFGGRNKSTSSRKIDTPEIHSHITNGLNLRERAYRLESEGKHDSAIEVMRLAVQEMKLAEKLTRK